MNRRAAQETTETSSTLTHVAETMCDVTAAFGHVARRKALQAAVRFEYPLSVLRLALNFYR